MTLGRGRGSTLTLLWPACLPNTGRVSANRCWCGLDCTGHAVCCACTTHCTVAHDALECSRAKDLCPDLIVVPYMFDKYEETSEKVGTGCLQVPCSWQW